MTTIACADCDTIICEVPEGVGSDTMEKMFDGHKIDRMNHIRYILCNDISEYMDLLDEFVDLAICLTHRKGGK